MGVFISVQAEDPGQHQFSNVLNAIFSRSLKSFQGIIVASGHLKMILNSQGVDSLTIVKMAASHMEAYILMRSSAKMEERHMVYLKTSVFLVCCF